MQLFYAKNKTQFLIMNIYHSHSCFSSNPHGTVSAVRVKLVIPSCSFLRFIIAWNPSAVVALSRVCSIKPGIIVLFSIWNHYNSWSFLDTTCLNFAFYDSKTLKGLKIYLEHHNDSFHRPMINAQAQNFHVPCTFWTFL